MINVEVTVWGPFACFTRSDARLDRISYDAPTPSACRGILEAIYCKPIEFWYEITGIDVLRPIRHINIRRNEVKKKIPAKGGIDYIDTNKERTQRGTSYLRDVAYTIRACIHVRKSYLPDIPIENREKKILTEFNKRVTGGKNFYQPYMGLRECICYYRPKEETDIPIQEDRDLGFMLYDIFDPESITPLDTSQSPSLKNQESPVCISYFHPVMKKGRITVPPYNSREVLKTSGYKGR